MDLRGTKVSLILLEGQKELIAHLHVWRNNDNYRRLCSTRRNTVTFDEFCNEIRTDFNHDRAMQYIIFENSTGLPIGTVYAYSLNQTDKHAFATIYLASDYTNKGHGVEAFRLFGEHIFNYYGLHKLYTEVYEYNNHSLHLLKKFGFIEEGRFQDHRFIDGKWCALIRLSIFRSQIEHPTK